MGFEVGISILNTLNSMNHLNKEIVNYLSAKFYEMTTITQKPIPNELSNLCILLEGLAFQKHKPIFWDELKVRFSDPRFLKFGTKMLYEMAFYLAILDFYNVDILKKIFKSDVDISHDFHILETFCNLWQKLQTIPNYSGPLPSETQLKSLRMLSINKESTEVSNLFEKLLGGPEYLKRKVWTKYYHRIGKIFDLD